jgi:hypothetical protein
LLIRNYAKIQNNLILIKTWKLKTIYKSKMIHILQIMLY